MEWTFKAARVDGNGGLEFIELSPAQKERIGLYDQALSKAVHSRVPNPKFSRYFVKEGIGTASFPIIAAGNIEYGMCQALHGEESAVSGLRSLCGRVGGDVVLGIVANSAGIEGVANPCGNCRDIMLDDIGKDLEIVRGAADGGLAVVAPMSIYLFDNFRKLFDRRTADPESVIALDEWVRDFGDDMSDIVRECEILENDFYSPPDMHPERKYYAMIIAKTGAFYGALDLMCDYHPIYPLRDAIRQAYRAQDYDLKHVTIVGRDCGVPPHVMYKDRQHLLEFNLYGELLSGAERNPPVYLVTYKSETEVAGIWKTSVKEWLSFPFTARNFMDLDKMADYYRSRVRQ